ncbi:MAG: four helix bundle protein, partial [Ruminococcus sp.]|nr:four helix bundle protein [Ruminococcus sp.]
GTSIGANVNEAIEAQSKKDFISKMGIALKETSETIYWLRLLHATKYITKKQFDFICADAYEIKRIISSIILSSNEKGGKRWKIILNSSPPLPRRSFRNLTGSASARRAGLLSPS